MFLGLQVVSIQKKEKTNKQDANCGGASKFWEEYATPFSLKCFLFARGINDIFVSTVLYLGYAAKYVSFLFSLEQLTLQKGRHMFIF